MSQDRAKREAPGKPVSKIRDDAHRVKSGRSKLTCYFWIRDQFLPETECSAAEASVLLALAGYGNPDGTSIRPGNPNLIAMTKVGLSTVKRALNFWKQHESGVLVAVTKGGGSGHATVFRIHMFDVTPKRVHHEPLFQTHSRKYESNADRQKAYRERKRYNGKGSIKGSTLDPHRSTDKSKSKSKPRSAEVRRKLQAE